MRYAGVAVAVAGVLVAAGAISYSVAGDNGSDVPTVNSADAGFARDMAVHHQQAVEMSYIVRDRTKDEEVRRLAYDIAQTQANQRGMLIGWLDLWGLPKVSSDEPMSWMGMSGMASGEDGALMPGMATDTEMKKLGTLNGKQAEIFYLQLMTDHHKGGVHMAQGCADKCTVAVEKRLAQGMVEAQQSEIQLMADLLESRGATPSS
ncbi:DUF305 domain-containing protein [Streptomyces phaeoluteigriseus]|uniref:DUF305 domain-containing protein n=1 Tax=Streptomyces phaeoluteigriseus TaxID=114686 RepID=A0ABY4ZGT9_9ACTN|nr:DUF305 domain-containing protein [Streptomyces phaeoluteigriseus]USQ87945.1 DUF305 domain-containing protein [Streptomyces phaeoluteigriseus]